MTAAGMDVSIEYRGPGDAGSYWGATLVYFSVDHPRDAATEVGVLFGNDAVAYLAEALGREASPAFAVEAARVVGDAWLRKATASDRFLAQSITISAATLREDPSLVEIARQSL